MIDDIRAARDAALERIATSATVHDVATLATELLGKRGALAQLKTRLGSLTDRRREEGRRPGAQRGHRPTQRRPSRPAAPSWPPASGPSRVEAERLDLTEYAGKPTRGRAHLVTQAWERLEDVFVGLGFQVAEGPEVETDWYNFEALNMGEGHPARSDFDTLFVDHAGAPAGTTVLRTHTSPVQIRTMLDGPAADLHHRPRPRVPPRHA